MQLWSLLRQDAFRSVRPLLVFAGLTGVTHVAVLTTMNEAIARLTDADAVSRLLLMFIGSNLLFAFCQIHYMRLASGRIEQAIVLLRDRLVARLCAAEMLEVNAIGPARVTEALGAEFQTISQAVPVMVVGSHCAVVVLLSSAYVYSFSLPTFWLLILIASVHVLIAWRSGRKIGAGSDNAHDAVVELSDRVTGLMAGFREAKINRVRAARIRDGIAQSARVAMEQRTAANVSYARDYTSAESVYYLSVAAVIFLLPAIASVRLETVAMAANAISFIVYPLHIMMASLPTYLNAENAARTIRTVHARLTGDIRPEAGEGEGWSRFDRLRLESLGFRHTAEAGGFAVGPLDLVVESGQIIFVTGGNGSGKSTLMHMLLGLYPASRGRIRVDGTVVDAGTLSAYRQLFSVIFSDNHLTREILGVPVVDETLARELLDLLEIGDKVRIADGAFTTISLSGGQRKRLALVAALLERRPILVLDEWAADQSPQFRETFYRRILPWIKARGTTVIAVTHDDKYFDAADQLIEIVAGQIAVRHQHRPEIALAS